MNRHILLAFALLCSLGAPLAAHAAAPGSVVGLQAQAQTDGSVLVQWSAVTGDIAAYRVYFSQKSILENGGYYDDVETTDGPGTSHMLRNIPATFQIVYVSVMAVNAQGEESPYFTEEVRVTRATPPASSSESMQIPASSAGAQASVAMPTPQETPAVTSLHLLSAQALSATQVGLTFSVMPVIDPALAPAAFSIVDAQGAALAIEQLTINGTNVTIQTKRQVAEAVYQVRLSEPLAGEGGLALDRIDRMAFFTGHSTGISAAEAAAQATANQQATQQPQTTTQPTPSQPGSLPDVVNFHLEATPQANQLFTVTGKWEYDITTPEGAFIIVRQSRDGGKTFNTPEFLPGNLDGVQIPNVTPQNFGLVVYVADAEGHSSPGVFKSIFGWNTPTVPTASVTPSTSGAKSVSSASTITAPSTPKAKRLSQTGAPMLGLAAIGALVGWRKMRKKK